MNIIKQLQKVSQRVLYITDFSNPFLGKGIQIQEDPWEAAKAQGDSDSSREALQLEYTHWLI